MHQGEPTEATIAIDPHLGIVILSRREESAPAPPALYAGIVNTA